MVDCAVRALVAGGAGFIGSHLCQRLLSDVWDYQYPGETRTVDVHVRRLREKLPFLETALVTVQQFGYKLLES